MCVTVVRTRPLRIVVSRAEGAREKFSGWKANFQVQKSAKKNSSALSENPKSRENTVSTIKKTPPSPSPPLRFPQKICQNVTPPHSSWQHTCQNKRSSPAEERIMAPPPNLRSQSEGVGGGEEEEEGIFAFPRLAFLSVYSTTPFPHHAQPALSFFVLWRSH